MVWAFLTKDNDWVKIREVEGVRPTNRLKKAYSRVVEKRLSDPTAM